MNNAEIAREIKKDMPCIFKKTEWLIAKVKRNMLKSKTFPYNECIDYKSPNKNDWFISITFTTKKILMYIPINIHRTTKGLRFAMQSDGSGTIAFYNSHMINRYAERENLNTKSSIETAKEFFKTHNAIPIHEVDQMPDGTINIIAPTNKGALYGFRTPDGIVTMNTYISNNTLCDKKKEILNASRLELEPLMNQWETKSKIPREITHDTKSYV